MFLHSKLIKNGTYQQVAQQDDNGDLANRGNVEGGLLLNFRAEVLYKHHVSQIKNSVSSQN